MAAQLLASFDALRAAEDTVFKNVGGNAGKDLKMKNLLSNKTMIAGLSLALVLLAAPARAQTRSLRFNVPFPFLAGDQVLSAGQYWVIVDTDFRRLFISAQKSTASAIVRFAPGTLKRPTAKADKGLLRFEKSGQQYLLTGVWKGGSVEGHGILPSRRLIESAKLEAGGPTGLESNLQ